MIAEWVVVEQYPDGTVWKHHFPTEESARINLEMMTEAHPGRTYVLAPAGASS